MKRCTLCNIHDTDDVYRVCEECRGKAARGWPGYEGKICNIEHGSRKVVSWIDGEPDDVDFVAAMGW